MPARLLGPIWNSLARLSAPICPSIALLMWLIWRIKALLEPPFCSTVAFVVWPICPTRAWLCWPDCWMLVDTLGPTCMTPTKFAVLFCLMAISPKPTPIAPYTLTVGTFCGDVEIAGQGGWGGEGDCGERRPTQGFHG